MGSQLACPDLARTLLFVRTLPQPCPNLARTLPRPCLPRPCPNLAFCPDLAPTLPQPCPDLAQDLAPTLPQPCVGEVSNCQKNRQDNESGDTMLTYSYSVLIIHLVRSMGSKTPRSIIAAINVTGFKARQHICILLFAIHLVLLRCKVIISGIALYFFF